eukprot:m.178826 g.178826  ORF g.178826 m.178826 type:complete len:53 (-) comp14630_c0_seq1:161-319(-)
MPPCPLQRAQGLPSSTTSACIRSSPTQPTPTRILDILHNADSTISIKPRNNN